MKARAGIRQGGRVAVLVSGILVLLSASPGYGAVIYESADMGGEAMMTLVVGRCMIPDSLQYLGARFHLDSPATVTAVGGHFKSDPTGNTSIFGAIVRLTDSNALPQGNPFTGEEVLATTVFSNPYWGSQDLRAPLSVDLTPGDYALVFGSELFGATGWNSMGTNNTLKPGASFFAWRTTFWADDSPSYNLRFVVEGVLTPEPATAALLVVGAAGVMGRRSRARGRAVPRSPRSPSARG